MFTSEFGLLMHLPHSIVGFRTEVVLDCDIQHLTLGSHSYETGGLFLDGHVKAHL